MRAVFEQRFLFGGLTVMAGFLVPAGPADFGWTAYQPLAIPVSAEMLRTVSPERSLPQT
jgi:heme/copper-type cytochrome/quinol oxidase subunit 1